jgi:hypothetical protein
MTDPKSTSEPTCDPARRDSSFDILEGYSGQEFNREREAAQAKRDPAGGMDALRDRDPPQDSRDIPTENGRRAFFDPATGTVHGSGSGAGGGSPGEDFDSDTAAGDGTL